MEDLVGSDALQRSHGKPTWTRAGHISGCRTTPPSRDRVGLPASELSPNDERLLRAPDPGSGGGAGICVRVLKLGIHAAFPVLC